MNFAQGITAIQNSLASPDEVANSLYDQLTVDERLLLLDGDIECGTLLFTIGYQGYCRTPIPAGIVKRLGIPGILFTDGPRGITLGNSTAFPCSAARAATFDLILEEQVGIAIGKEARAQGANLYAGVCINLARHPGWGRAQESYGEDPIVLGLMGTALARGVREQVMVCVKHYALNSMENMRFTVNVTVDEKTLHQVYLPHFKMIVDAGVESIMSAYNSINGLCCGESSFLLNQILRDEWKFKGFVISDFFWGLRDGPASLKAGLDIEMPARQVRAQTLSAALELGQLSMDDVKKSCIRILATELTYYTRVANQPIPSISVVGCVDHRHLARQIAAASMVVIKNDIPAPQEPPLLPLNRASVKKVTVIGKLAKSRQTGDWGSSWVHDTHVVSALSAFHQDTSLTTLYNDGSNIQTAVETAKTADVTVVIVGYTGRDEGEYVLCTDEEVNKKVLPGWLGGLPTRKLLSGFGWLTKVMKFKMGGDRRSLALNEHDIALAKAIASVSNKSILILVGSSTIILDNELREKFTSILYGWYWGCEGGNALQDVLWGDAEPSGRLPFVIPASEKDLPAWDPDAREVTYDRWWGYRLLNRQKKIPVYPFGFGLGYGQHEFIDFVCPVVLDSRIFRCMVTVKNTSNRDSSVVVQIYGAKETLTSDDYTRVLLGFQKALIKTQDTRVVEVICHLDPLAAFNTTRKKFEVMPDHYILAASKYEGDPASLFKNSLVNRLLCSKL